MEFKPTIKVVLFILIKKSSNTAFRNQVTSNTTFRLYFHKEIALLHIQGLFRRSDQDAF